MYYVVLLELLRQRHWDNFNTEIRKELSLSDTEKFSIFNTACSKPRIERSCVATLIEAGFFVRLQQEKDTAAYYPICDGRLDILRLLVAHDPTLMEFSDEDGNTLLHYASAKGKLKIADFLMSKFSIERINAKNNHNKSALDHACDNNDNEMRNLIKKYSGNWSRLFFRK